MRDVFRLAKENAPSIIFIDEVDAIATARFDAQTGADREVGQCLLLTLLACPLMHLDLLESPITSELTPFLAPCEFGSMSSLTASLSLVCRFLC